MRTGGPLREDFDAAQLRGLAQRSRGSAQSRRLLALAVICDGHRRSDAAHFAGVGLQVIRDRVLRFNAAGPAGLKDRKASGPPRELSEEQWAALAAMVESRHPRDAAVTTLQEHENGPMGSELRPLV